ncbi:hypothetical protein [Longitalea luteola]|uniref:hypothetical protein n=1 Tax=Longitalea luteola TaxID=2812563 RepID=UPI001A96E759|nr:hypothetical protein [Longitalea luteola]
MEKKSSKGVLCLMMVFFLIITSCKYSSLGYYYTSPANSDMEAIQINDDTLDKLITFSAFEIKSDSSFNAVVIFKLLDTSKYVTLSNVDFDINGLKGSVAKKKALFIDAPQEVKYDSSVMEIDRLNKRLSLGFPIEFTFKYDAEMLREKKKIHVSITINLFENGKEVKLNKNFDMLRHVRYKSSLLMH